MDLTLIKKKKNIILIAVIAFLIIIAIVLFLLLKKDKLIITNTVITFSTDDSSLSIEIPEKYSFSKVNDDSYLLVLNSAEIASSIYFSSFSRSNIRDTDKFIECEKNDYISKFSNISEVSEISELTINGSTAYNYHFRYKENMFVDVYWILKDDEFIVIDLDINTNNSDFYSHITEILDTLKF